MAGSDQPARDGESGMPRNPLTLIIIAIILLTVSLLAGCYLYSLQNHCKPVPVSPLDGVIHYECENQRGLL